MTDQTHAAREARLKEIRDRIRLGGEINSAGVSWILAELSSADKRAEEMAGLLREAAEVIERLWIFEHKSDESRLRLFTIRLRTAADHAAKDRTHG